MVCASTGETLSPKSLIAVLWYFAITLFKELYKGFSFTKDFMGGLVTFQMEEDEVRLCWMVVSLPYENSIAHEDILNHLGCP